MGRGFLGGVLCNGKLFGEKALQEIALEWLEVGRVWSSIDVVWQSGRMAGHAAIYAVGGWDVFHGMMRF